MDAIDQLNRIGQHLWLDDISMTTVEDGTIARYRDECSISGVTANPTIFERSISTGAYDERIARGDREGGDIDSQPAEVFWQLAIEDVQMAADLFHDIHRRTDGRTGWVSIELSPDLAYDTAGSIKQGEDLHRRVDRPNVMVKVPGTTEGVAAIEELTFLGVPVNVTLLFGRDQWDAARRAYVQGLERRLADDRSLSVASVASFFLSRIDHHLDPLVDGELSHQAAILSAASIHEAWRHAHDEPRWARLEAEGAQPQQLLWASTSPKASELDETYYALRLAAPDTIMTLPVATLDALCVEGQEVERLDVRAPSDVGRTIDDIESTSGTTLERVAAELQHDGVDAFAASYASLLDTIGEVRDQMRTR